MEDNSQIGSAEISSEMTVGIAGAGTMGAGIAQVAALAGHRVLLYDTNPGTSRAAVEGIHSAMQRLVQKQLLSPDTMTRACDHLTIAESFQEFAACGLVIEAAIEDLEVKRALFLEIEKVVEPKTLLATNTSSLSITAIGASLARRERLGGMHFFNPAPVMPLVEIVRGASTSQDTANALYQLAKRWGKTPVHARSSPGFIVNRVARPFYAEALRVLQERAADCATIDAVMRDAGGFRMGPFELMDLIGNDVNYSVTRSVFDAFYCDPRFAPSNLQLELVQAGFLGRKTGRGFYEYAAGKPICVPRTEARAAVPTDIQVYGDSHAACALARRLSDSGVRFARTPPHADGRIAAANRCVVYRTDGRTATMRASATGIRNTVVMDLTLDPDSARRVAIATADNADGAAHVAATGLLQSAGFEVSTIGDVPGMIVMRTVAMLANEAADAVNQGVCSAPDLNVAMCKGVNYPRGPLEWTDALGIQNVLQVLDNLAAEYGEDRYRASPLLRRKALAGKSFCSEDHLHSELLQHTGG